MKNKKLLIMITLLLLLAGTNCFAQNTAALQKALQGTWNLISIMENESITAESYFKENKVTIQFIVSGSGYSMKYPNKTDTGTFTISPGYIMITNSEYNEKMPYIIEGKILILFSDNSALVFRKK